jgi:hypothetical protein
VAPIEPVREITREDCGVYFESRNGYSYRGARVANATCENCEAKYIAWFDLSACEGYGASGYFRPHPDGLHIDLSFRSTFDDEPGEADMPKWSISHGVAEVSDSFRKTLDDTRIALRTAVQR